MSRLLDPMTLPFSGRHLIEASAGTGKTYTITSLVLRLILGVGVPSPLALGQILIVTFTVAATEELRARVRSRLASARLAFETGDADGDAVITSLLEQCDRDTAVRLLHLAELELDLASIHTIHGFAQRTLQQYAFESGSAFDARLDEQAYRLHEDVALDIWRERVYPLAALASDAVTAEFPTADAFVKKLAEISAHERPVYVGEPHDDWPGLLERLAEGLAELGRVWPTNRDACAAILDGPVFKKGAEQAIETAFNAFDALVSHGATPSLSALGALRAETLAEGMHKARNKGVVLESLPIAALLEDLDAAVQALPLRLLVDAEIALREQLLVRKQQRNLLGFDDLLRLIDEGLKGDGAERLASVLREQFPVAMIDEFQDTDPMQWRVFNRIYSNPNHNTGGCLLLIGDPKQAIYKFRGADIYAYISARRDTPERHVLGTNYRSVPALVEAINHLFSQRADNDPFIAKGDIPFESVAPCEPAQPSLTGSSDTPAAMQILHIRSQEPLSSTTAREVMALKCAHHLAALLQRGVDQSLHIDGRALQPGDVAILVRSRHEAEALKPALRSAGIAWAYQSRESVYQQPEAEDVYALLDAVIARGEEQKLRSALARRLMCQSLHLPDQLRNDDQLLFEHQLRFERFHDTLRRDGVLAMVRAVLFEYGVVERLLQEADGERRLTDALHVAELLQLERECLDGDEALLARLARHIAQPDGDNESQQLRLESDRGLVQIITMHASKGLEYPVVYVPFPWTARKSDVPAWNDPDTLTRFWDLQRRPDALERADRERLAEDTRLLYVAFTRAKQLLVTGLVHVKPGTGPDLRNAFDHLLDFDGEDFNAVVARLSAIPDVAMIDADSIPQAMLQTGEQTNTVLAARAFSGTIRDDWRISSYTSLTRITAHANDDVFRQPEIAPERLLDAPVCEDGELIDFPRGASHGSFLHSLLEHADFDSIAAGEVPEADIREAMTAAGYEDRWLPTLAAMLRNVLCVPLDGERLRLANLPASSRHAEMAFDLALGSFDGERLDALLRERGLLEPGAPRLVFNDIRGLLTGFIDLVFEYQGRYYVADYKSNYLGPSRADYSDARMHWSVQEHRYDLQYLIYSVALERHLRQRLGVRYNPKKHFGGAWYLYLRGIRADTTDRFGIYFARPDDDLRAQVDALLGGGQ